MTWNPKPVVQITSAVLAVWAFLRNAQHTGWSPKTTLFLEVALLATASNVSLLHVFRCRQPEAPSTSRLRVLRQACYSPRCLKHTQHVKRWLRLRQRALYHLQSAQ